LSKQTANDPLNFRAFRSQAINIEHPFGLPIWKPALYKKSRSITRNAEFALHSIPSAAAERHLLPGNLLWTVIFGWWLALLCFGIAGVIFIGEVIGGLGWRGKRAGGYARTVAGLGWYIGWPFGKYVEGKGFKKKEAFLDEEDQIEDTFDEDDGEVDAEGGEAADRGDDEVEPRRVSSEAASSSSGRTVKGPRASTDGFRSRENSVTSVDAWKPSPAEPATERDPLVPKTRIGRKGHIQQVDFAKGTNGQARDSLYGAIGFNGDAKDQGKDRVPTKFNSSPPHSRMARLVGGIFYWPLFILFIAPALIVVCLLCWGMVITIPMARLTWALLKHLARGPLDVKFRRAPKVAVPLPSPGSSPTLESEANDPAFTFRRARLKAGQLAPTPGPDSTVLLCIYRAVGMQYYKYTVGGVNIMFVNLLPLVFFTIFDGLVLLPMVEHGHTHNPIIELLASQALIFILGLASVIPLSYFIGMAVASISAQSSIGMGAVINATFGSVIEIVLYSIALTQGKGKLVEGSIVGSFLAAILLMPGGSMISAAFKRKEQKFNARSAGVTSTMLIMAVIGTLTPTLFYQTYGSVSLAFGSSFERQLISRRARLAVHAAM
jgi:Ca2+:H+ antiporter